MSRPFRPDVIYLVVPIEAEEMPGADGFLRGQAEHYARESNGRLLEGPPARKETPEMTHRDCVIYVYPAERPDLNWRAS